MRITEHSGLECETKKSVSLKRQDGAALLPLAVPEPRNPSHPETAHVPKLHIRKGVGIAGVRGVSVPFREARAGAGDMAQ